MTCHERSTCLGLTSCSFVHVPCSHPQLFTKASSWWQHSSWSSDDWKPKRTPPKPPSPPRAAAAASVTWIHDVWLAQGHTIHRGDEFII